MKTKNQLRLIVLILVLLGGGAALYKYFVLGFSFTPDSRVKVWAIETKITFEPNKVDGEKLASVVKLNRAMNVENFSVIEERNIAKNYQFSSDQDKDGTHTLKWINSNTPAETQTIYYRVSAYRTDEDSTITTEAPPNTRALIIFEGADEEAAKIIVDQLKQQYHKKPVEMAKALASMMNIQESDSIRLLLNKSSEYGGIITLTSGLLNQAGIQARTVQALLLEDNARNRKLTTMLQVYKDGDWILLDPKTAQIKNEDDYLLWLVGNESLFEVVGAKRYTSNLTFSTNSSNVLASRASLGAGHKAGAMLIDFSIYSLPIAQQNTFKLLLLIPLGAFVVVVLRNLVGISTSGTFMPILIAMTFLETSLVWGLALFVVVVAVGLVLRSYLSHLNLLLVPRISAVLVFVIIIFVTISVLSIKLGFEAGLQVTIFPMIIISWTIERMSVLWEEEGPRDVFVQGGGSLFTAVIVYFVMSNPWLGHITYSFPELLLVLLATIILIGSYSGYRLSELRRFEPMTRED
ncbi:UUP1 family membrane protein [Persicirhabdus sediminis]|uniref:UUP1 family membrane protein n=1 Tax=Persicirhabdus sediminis TaxID=454144 RepID=A0A8J7SJK4_9BACT|nr:UUP1 family membrane protein [Persicirhabdus sediminis]MBK1791414.1 UUP1 family membrane protein [Persicirhabdus sediminis]